MRGNWRRYIRSKGPRAAAISRRAFHRADLGVLFLLDYALADTFTRATEAAFVDPRDGWAFQAATEAANWLGNNVARIFSDGAVLIEEARTNLIDFARDAGPTGDAGNWTAGTAVYNQTGGQAAADGKASTMQVICDAAEFGPTNTLTDVAGDNALSMYARRESVDEGNTYKFGVFSGVTPTGTGEITMATVNWRRDSIVMDEAGAPQAITPRLSGRSTDAGDTSTPNFDVAWDLVQWEGGSFISTPIRTSGAAATRNKDVLKFAAGNYPTRLVEAGVASWSVVPNYSSAQLVAAGTTHYVFSGGSNEGLVFRVQAGVARLAYLSSAGGVKGQGAVTFSALQRMTIIVDWTSNELVLSGFTTGDGTVSLSGGSDIVPASEALTIGHRAAAGDLFFNGVIERPVAA